MATTKTNKNTLTSQNSAECDALLPKIGAVPEASLLNITTAPRFVVDDGETLFRWANTDRELLIAAGLSPEVIDDLQTGAGALRHIQALWNSWRLSKDQWQKKSREGEALIKKLIHIFLFAYRDNPAALKKVRNVRIGYSKTAKVQKLENISVIGKDHPEELQKINFDMTLLDKASALSALLGDLLGDRQSGTLNGGEIRKLRLQAYTFLQNTIREVREYGKFVFYRNEERYRGYVNARNRKNRKKTKVAAEPEVTTTEVTEQRDAA